MLIVAGSGELDWALAIAQRADAGKARVALERKLAVILHSVWLSGEPFRWAPASWSTICWQGFSGAVLSWLERPCVRPFDAALKDRGPQCLDRANRVPTKSTHSRCRGEAR
jgi:hypothetical protein